MISIHMHIQMWNDCSWSNDSSSVDSLHTFLCHLSLSLSFSGSRSVTITPVYFIREGVYVVRNWGILIVARLRFSTTDSAALQPLKQCRFLYVDKRLLAKTTSQRTTLRTPAPSDSHHRWAPGNTLQVSAWMNFYTSFRHSSGSM